MVTFSDCSPHSSDEFAASEIVPAPSRLMLGHRGDRPRPHRGAARLLDSAGECRPTIDGPWCEDVSRRAVQLRLTETERT